MYGQCNATYCEETTRHLHTRVAEHKEVSARTGRPLTVPPNSSIREHSHTADHPISTDNFKILATVSKYDLKIAESILIHKFRPTLNDNSASTQLHILS